MVTGMPAWREVQPLIVRLGEPVSDPWPLTPVRLSWMTWAARAANRRDRRQGQARRWRAEEKARWCAAHLPALGTRGYPVPAIVWHGMISAEWQVTVQTRLPGRPLARLDGPMLQEALRLVELQAGAGVPAEDDGFTGYVAHVLFDDWDDVWNDAPQACEAADSTAPATGGLSLTNWITSHGDELGRRYANELNRHYHGA